MEDNELNVLAVYNIFRYAHLCIIKKKIEEMFRTLQIIVVEGRPSVY